MAGLRSVGGSLRSAQRPLQYIPVVAPSSRPPRPTAPLPALVAPSWASSARPSQRRRLVGGPSPSSLTFTAEEWLWSGDSALQLAQRGTRPFRKRTVEELLDLSGVPLSERVAQVEEALLDGLARMVVLLQDLPLGFGDVRSIRDLIRGYMKDIRDLEGTSSQDASAVLACIEAIYARQGNVVTHIANGLNEFHRKLGESSLYSSVGKFASAGSEGLSTNAVPAMERIEQALDEFFTAQTTCRLLIAQCVQNDQVRQDSTVHRMGAVCFDTRPSRILTQAYAEAVEACDFGLAAGRVAPLVVNGVPAKDYFAVSSTFAGRSGLRYVDEHLTSVFQELLKNALNTTCRRALRDGVSRPIEVTFLEGSLDAENGRIVRISDGGEGLTRADLQKIWSYFYSSRRQVGEFSDVGQELFAGIDVNEKLRCHTGMYGLGLPLSRVLMRYWGGDIELRSIPRRGTDVYVYL